MIPSRRPTLLLIDDDPDTTALVCAVATEAGFDVMVRPYGEALRDMACIRPDAVLADFRLAPIGLNDRQRIRAAHPDCVVAVMTRGGATAAPLEPGAADYEVTPLDAGRIRAFCAAVCERRGRREASWLAFGDLARVGLFCGMAGRGQAMQRLFGEIRRYAPHARTALILGETGTGKELVAQALHGLSPRRDRRFLTMNCSAVVDTLFESELFGHVRGAFTGASEAKAGRFEVADGGTLFLDEIGELPLSMQPKLLRAVELGETQRVGGIDTRNLDVRIVAASNRDLLSEATAGRFRRDLYYRLSIVELRLPPLRDRLEDIPELTAAFIQASATRMRKSITGITAAAERLLQRHHWPGNVRELQNVIERACLVADDRILSDRDVLAAMPPARLSPVASAAPMARPARSLSALRPVDRDHILKTLEDASGNKAKAARMLGVSRRALYRRLDRIDLKAAVGQ